jgi:hypothetical protein
LLRVLFVQQLTASFDVVQELKERYYKICKKLYESKIARGFDVEEYQKKLDGGGYDFDKSGFHRQSGLLKLFPDHLSSLAMELNRKAKLETLYNRSYDQIKDEEIMFMELKRREAMNERFFDTRQSAERVYGKHELSHSVERHQVQMYGQANPNDPRLKKKRRDDIPGAGPIITIPQNRIPGMPSGLPSATPTTPGFDGPKREQKPVPGTSLRSFPASNIKPSQQQQKVLEYFESFGLGKRSLDLVNCKPGPNTTAVHQLHLEQVWYHPWRLRRL